MLRDSLGSPRREDTDLLLPRVPLGELLPEPASHWLRAHDCELRLSHRVECLNATEQGIDIDGESFAAAIIATAPQHAAALWPASATAYDFEPIATVYLQFAEHIKTPFPLTNLIGKLGQWVVDRGNGLLACVLSGHGEWEKLDDSALAAALEDELAIAEKARWHKVIREKRATFSCRPDLARPPTASALAGLWLAGDYVCADYPATLEAAVRSGVAAARAILLK